MRRWPKRLGRECAARGERRGIISKYDKPPKKPADKAVAAERERCAMVCDEIGNRFGENTAHYCANAILYGIDRAARIKNGEE